MKKDRKSKSRKGFTLAETLLAILILLLVAELMYNGVSVARNVVLKIMVKPNAQSLLSTTVTALRNELGSAQNIVISSDGKTITYYSPDRAANSTITAGDEDIKLQDYADYTGDDHPARNIVTVTDNLTCTFESAEATAGSDVLTINNLTVGNSSGDVLTELDTLIIRLFEPMPA